MTPTPRQKTLLAVLGIVLAVYLWQRFGTLGGGDEAGRAGGAGRGAIDSHVEELRLADLEPRPSSYSAGRDPFRYGSPPRPPGPTPEEIAAELARQREAEARARALAAQQAPPPDPPVPQPPQFTLRYLGSFGSPARRIAVFSDGSNIYNALQGEVLEGKFIVERIGFESVDVAFVGFPDAPPQRFSAGG